MQQNFLDPLWERLHELGSSEAKLLAVPGNHDLLRPDSKSDNPASDTLLSEDGFARVADRFWADSACSYRGVIDEAFAPYLDWWNLVSHRPNSITCGALPGDFAVTLSVADHSIGIIGLNTAFLQLSTGDYRERLVWNAKQLLALFPAGIDRWLADHDQCLLLTHHGSDWLTPEARSHGETEIAPAGRFAAHIFGHMHETEIRHIRRGGSDKAARPLQGCSLFGMEKRGDPPTVQRAHGYSAGRILFDEDGAALRLWPRIATSKTGTWRYIRDHEHAELDSDEGSTPHRLHAVGRARVSSETTRRRQTGPDRLNPVPSMPSARELPARFLVAFSFAGEERTLVQAIAEAVERKLGRGGVFFDDWYLHHIAGHAGDLKLQEIFASGCDLVVLCVSEHYVKPWPRTEYEAIRGRMMKAWDSADPRERDAILPIRVGDGELSGLGPTAIIPEARNRDPEDTAQLIVDRLRTLVPGSDTTASAKPSWPEAPPDLDWPVADHRHVRDAFAESLTANTPRRYLPVRGPSMTGKTRITNKMLANALNMPWLACGRFDFKGTANLEQHEVGPFVQHLDIEPPPAGARLNDCLAHILNQIIRHRRPTLLIFDTYEHAGEARHWVEKQLLPSLLRASWLRVAIVGQQVPEASGMVWTSTAHATLELQEPLDVDWLEFGRLFEPDLSLDTVRDYYERVRARGKVYLMSVLFERPGRQNGS